MTSAITSSSLPSVPILPSKPSSMQEQQQQQKKKKYWEEELTTSPTVSLSPSPSPSLSLSPSLIAQQNSSACRVTSRLVPLLRETERSFLRKDYRRSFGLVHGWFRDKRHQLCEQDWHTEKGYGAENSQLPLTTRKTMLRLVPSIRIPLSPEAEKSSHGEGDTATKAEDGGKVFNGTFSFLVADASSESLPSPVAAAVSTSISFPNGIPDPKETASTAAATMVDQLAVIGLQSWYELSRMERKQQRKRKQQKNYGHKHHYRWSYLVDILEHYNTPQILWRSPGANHHHGQQQHFPSMGRPLSLELLATVWIVFWESHGHDLEAFFWTVQVLQARRLLLRKPIPEASTGSNVAASTTASDTRTILEELWLKCVCQQIPKHVGSNLNNKNNSINNHPRLLAQKLLKFITENQTDVLDQSALEHLWEEIRSCAVDESNQSRGRIIVRTKNNKAGDDTGNSLLVTTGLLETIDAYLEEKDEDDPGDGVKNTNTAAIRDVCISRRTMLRARDWLLLRQQQQQPRGGDIIQNEDGTRDDVPASSDSMVRNKHNFVRKKAALLPSSPTQAMAAVIQALRTSWLKVWTETRRHTCSGSDNGVAASRKILRLLYSFVAGAVDGFEIPSTKNDIASRSSSTTVATATVSAIDSGTVQTSLQDEHPNPTIVAALSKLQRHLQQALLAVVIFWMGYKGRRLLARCGRAVVWASLAPLREILDALGPAVAASTTPIEASE